MICLDYKQQLSNYLAYKKGENMNFKNDYNVIADEKILSELMKFSKEKYIGYGEDIKTKELNEYVNKLLNLNVDTYVLSGGTLTNVIGLNQMLQRPFECVMTVDSSHINVHETGAIESSGRKIVYLPKIGGKIDISKIESEYIKYVDNHMVKPKAIYLSNATELGETYSLIELTTIYDICKKLDMFLFIDGARLAVSMQAEGYSLANIAKVCDMFYLGGTKLGLPFGEMLIIVNDKLKTDFKYLIKNKLGLMAKGFVGSIMFLTLLKNDYYLTLAKRENDKADKLREAFKSRLIYPNKTNQVFIIINKNEIKALNGLLEYEVWEEIEDTFVIRLVTSIATTDEEIKECINLINNLK